MARCTRHIPAALLRCGIVYDDAEAKHYMHIKVMGVIAGVVVAGLGLLLFLHSRPVPSDSTAPQSSAATNVMETTPNTHVVFKTTKGDIELELFTDRMPVTTGNFLKLAREGFYNGTKFHRVIEGFMIQGGDPNSEGADASQYGTGGPGYTIEDEFVEGLSNVRGTISMANTGQPNSGGSQFFINLADNTFLDFDKQPLTSRHPVFGRVVGGMEIVDAIAQVPTSERDVPLEPVVITEVVVQ